MMFIEPKALSLHGIYQASLRKLYRGCPMWYLEPHATDEPQIGDIGMVEEGAFVRLCNIHQNKADSF